MKYNPHSPYILGEEWVPIRQANYFPDTITERGYSFAIDHAAVIVTAGTYVAAPSSTSVSTIESYTALYPAGYEDLTGPIRSVIVPVSAVTATGGGSGTVASLLYPNDSSWSDLALTDSTSAKIGLNFDMENYANAALAGKRIVDVRLLYTAFYSGDPIPVSEARDSSSIAIGRHSSLSNNTVGFASEIIGPDSSSAYTPVQVVSFTDVNQFHNPAATVLNEPWAYPWRQEELAWFGTTSASNNRLIVIMQASSLSTVGAFVDILISYAALEILYCEEKRVKYGAHRAIGGSASLGNPLLPGSSYVPLRGTDFTVTGSVAAGSYTVTQTRRTFQPFTSGGNAPSMYALRQLYEIPSMGGVVVNQSMTVNDQFTKDSTDVIPQITLHHAGGVVTGSHVYGQQLQAPVYASITATQEIEDDPVTVSATFPQVRFYARRYGRTTTALTLADVATGTSTVSISVADFDALEEIVDGWREVTLRFASPPTFAVAAGDVDWRWTSTGEDVSNQWQILGAYGISVTGTQEVGKASYYAPQGNTVDLSWKYPAVSVATEDTFADAVLIFSQDPPTVTGFSVATTSQAVSGIGLDCTTAPCCIPTGISYNRVTWSAQTALPVTGFGQYELQRSDTVTTAWQTIMSATSTTVTGFSDYEARVNVATTYRIRVVNVLDFAGSWTTGSPITIASPGVQTRCGSNAVLIFTNNQAPTGSLAYVMGFEGSPEETFSFPESETVQLQRMYRKDFFTAFRPSERGGERFKRAIIVQKAAIALPSLGNFRSMRDLAWQDLPYVCVRDELGNRWFATVLVPDGTVSNNRRTYIAQIEIIEATDTPTEVNPST